MRIPAPIILTIWCVCGSLCLAACTTDESTVPSASVGDSIGAYIEVETPSGVERHRLDGETLVMTDDHVFHVSLPTPFYGLVRVPQGDPMAMLTVWVDGGTPSRIRLHSGALVQSPFGDAYSIRFLWYETEADAFKSADSPAIDSARWGVVDGGRIQWMNSFLPGTGLEREDGVVVSLLEVKDDGAEGLRIHVGFEDGDDRWSTWYSSTGGDAEVRVENPGKNGLRVDVVAWSEDSAIATAFWNGELVGKTSLQIGERWGIPNLSTSIRLDTILRSASPGEAEGTEILGILLRTPTRELLLREGEKRYLDGYYVGFGVER